MTTEVLKTIIAIVLTVIIVVFIAKRLIKVAIAVAIILALFYIGFVMDGTQIREFFKIDNFLNQQQAENVESFMNEYDQKRKDYEVVDPEIIGSGMVDTVASGTTMIIEGLGEINISDFTNSVAEQIVKSSESVDMDELRAEIKKQLPGATDEQIDVIMDEISNKKDSMQTETE